MTFTPTLSNQQLDDLRGNYAGAMYLALCPNAVVYRAEVRTAGLTNPVYGQIFTETTLAGDADDVRIGMTYIIHSDVNDLRTELHRGRVRQLPNIDVGLDTAVLPVGESSFMLDDAQFITVIDSYDIWARLGRFVGNSQRIDFDIPYHELPPLIHNLESSYVTLTSATSASFSFAPLGQAIEDGATIDTWLWDVGDGTITTGTSTTKDITVSFPAGHRWVRVTVTDDNGVSSFFVFEVYVLDFGDSALYVRARDYEIRRDLDNGANASVVVWGDMSNVINGTRATLFSAEKTGADTSINGNVNFIGYTRDEENSIATDARHTIIADSTIAIEGLVTRLANIPAPPIRLASSSNPTQWGQTSVCTPSRMVAYLLTCYSTYANISAMQVLDDDEYEFSPLATAEAGMIESANDILDAYNARLNFANAGATEVKRMAVYLPSLSRDALPTIATITDADISDYVIDVDYVRPIGQVLVFGGVYRGVNLETAIYQSRAPAVSLGAGNETAELNGQVLERDASDSDARDDISLRASNHLAYSNPTDTLTVTLRDGWHFVAPHYAQWYKFNLPSQNPRGVAFDGNTRWILQSIDINADSDAGSRQVVAIFRRETESIGAQIVVTRVRSQVESTIPTMPPIPDYPALDGWGELFYPTDTPSDEELQPFNTDTAGALLPLPYEDTALPSTDPFCTLLQLRFNSAERVEYPFTWINIARFNVTAEGVARIATITGNDFDFEASNEGFTTDGSALYVASEGWSPSTALNVLFEYDFTSSQFDTEQRPPTGTQDGATYSAGNGWRRGGPGALGRKFLWIGRDTTTPIAGAGTYRLTYTLVGDDIGFITDSSIIGIDTDTSVRTVLAFLDESESPITAGTYQQDFTISGSATYNRFEFRIRVPDGVGIAIPSNSTLTYWKLEEIV